jgi:MFS transporter, MHS family, alpha-ketoglutarate permease
MASYSVSAETPSSAGLLPVGGAADLSSDQRAADGKSHIGMLLRAVAGVSFEYYDYIAFGVFTPFFADQFFNKADPVVATLNALLVFALGFVMRPIGAMVAGRVADRFGRKPVMIAALTLAAAGSLAIALTPTYDTLGVFAVVILVAARLFQGFGHGMESISAYIYTAEIADRKRRGFHTSAYPIAMNFGVIQGTVFGAILTSILTNNQMHAWGWRIPFIIGALYGLVIVLIRTGLTEPASYENAKKQARSDDQGYWRTLWTHRRTIGILFLLWPAATCGAYSLQVGYTQYAITAVHARPQDAFWAGLIAQCVYMVALPLWAIVSDLKGRRFNYTVGLVGTAILAIPLQMMLGPSLGELVIPMTVALIVFAAMMGCEPTFINELIPNKVRAQVMSVPSSFGAVIFGSTAPYLRSWTAAYGSPYWFTVYFIVLCVIALVTVRLLPETAGRDLSE